MHIVWFSWKDHAHPTAGGAEVVKSELARRLVANGHQLIVVTARYKGSAQESDHDGYRIIRLGNRFTVYWQAWRYYRKKLRSWADFAIDEMNTIPFFARFYTGVPTVLIAYQLAREVWFHEIFFPLNIIGYLIEPIYLRFLRSMSVITICESSRTDIARYGFDRNKIHIIPMASTIEPLDKLPNKITTHKLLILGALRSMKQPIDAIRAFEIAKKDMLELSLDVAGAPIGAYGEKVLKHIKESPYRSSITYHGRVSADQKMQLMRDADFLLVASQKEGWGLIVSEAASQGTASIVYDVDGLRDAVFLGKGGLLTKPTPADMARAIVTAFTQDQSARRLYAYQQSKRMTFDRSYEQFVSILLNIARR